MTGRDSPDRSVNMDSSSDDECLVMENGIIKALVIDSENFREYWVNDYFADREEDGEYHRIFNDLLKHPAKFFDYFRMMPETFFYILGKIVPHITKESNFRTCIGPEEKLMVTLRFGVSRVTPSLLLCAAPAVREESLLNMGVSCVISAAPELPPPPLPRQVTLLLRLPLKDHPTEDLLSQLHTVADTIHQVIQDGGCVLVHCLAGVSRSAALVLAYLVKHLDLSLRSAFLHLRSCRPAVRPNTGFFRQLIEFERQTRGTTSVDMVYNPAARAHIPDVYESDYQKTLCFMNNRNFGKH